MKDCLWQQGFSVLEDEFRYFKTMTSLLVSAKQERNKVTEKVDLGINMFPHSICTERLCRCSLNLGNYRHFPLLGKTVGK